MNSTVPQGWQCPECKTNYAPSVEKCECTKVTVVKQLDDNAIYPNPYTIPSIWPYYPPNPGKQWWGDPDNWTITFYTQSDTVGRVYTQ